MNNDKLTEPAVEPVPIRDMLIQAASMAIVLERRGTYQSATRVADAVLESARYASPPPPAEPAAEPVKGLFVDLIAQHPGLAEELAAIVIDAPPAEPAVEPRNHVGNSKFESWYSEYNASGKGDKQRARDAYAAGMGDPVYLPSPPPPAELAVEPCGYDETTGNCTNNPCCFLPMDIPPAERDVCKIMLEVVPGADGMGHEVYAKNVSEVVNKLTEMGQRIEDLEGAPPPARPAVEPFGYFRAEPFGWTDCAPTDEGAKALYEVPPPTEPARTSQDVCTVPWLSEDEIGRIFLKFEGSLQSLRDCANEIEKAYRRKARL